MKPIKVESLKPFRPPHETPAPISERIVRVNLGVGFGLAAYKAYGNEPEQQPGAKIFMSRYPAGAVAVEKQVVSPAPVADRPAYVIPKEPTILDEPVEPHPGDNLDLMNFELEAEKARDDALFESVITENYSEADIARLKQDAKDLARPADSEMIGSEL